MTEPERPDPCDQKNWAHHHRVVSGAVIVPTDDRGLVQQCGVFDADMGYCDDAVLWRGKPLMTPPDPPDAEQVAEKLSGRFLWGGVLHFHFGHFLAESLGRVWAYDRADRRPDGILFLEKRGSEEGGAEKAVVWSTEETGLLSQFQKTIFGLFDIDVPIGVVRLPVQVEQLIVPGQGVGMGEMANGTPAFRQFVQNNFARDIKPDGPKRLYISRSAYGARRGGAIGEEAIEARLEKDGYEIFHPQKETVETQIARYKAAEDIVALDGSALHLLAMVATPSQKVAVMRRRTSPVSEGLVTHLQSFTGKKPLVIDAIKQNWIRSDRSRPDRFSLAELNMPTIGQALSGADMASADGWENQSDEERDRIIGALNKDAKLTFHPEAKANAPQPETDTPEEFVKTPHGVELPMSTEVSRPWLMRKIQNGRYEKEEIRGALKLVTAEDRVLECGAGIGVVGTTVAQVRRPQKIMSFEANPRLIPVVEETYAHNRVDKIISVTHGVLLSGADLPESISFNISSRFAFSSIGVPQREVEETVSVPVHDFADVRAALKPTVLLMDIEGGELEFLRHADLSGIAKVVMEFHPDIYGNEGAEFCKSTLQEVGFKPVKRLSTDTVWAARRAV